MEKSEIGKFSSLFHYISVNLNLFKASPNHSLKANLGLSNSMMMTKSPNLLNISDHMARKMPKTTSSKHRYSFSPMPCRFDESPNVSPIKKDLKEIKSDTGTDSPSSNFLKRRDLQRDLG
jgi:hypothetical protein